MLIKVFFKTFFFRWVIFYLKTLLVKYIHRYCGDANLNSNIFIHNVLYHTIYITCQCQFWHTLTVQYVNVQLSACIYYFNTTLNYIIFEYSIYSFYCLSFKVISSFSFLFLKKRILSDLDMNCVRFFHISWF